MPAGRPIDPVPQNVADEVTDWISEGKTLREYCRQPEKPSYGTIYNWVNKDEEFAERFARAREQGEEIIAQECLAIADDGTNDYMEQQHGDDEESSWRFNGEHVQRSKLRVDTRLKLLAKWNPKKYGDKIQNEHSGEIRTIVVEPDQKPDANRPALKPEFEKDGTQ